MNGYPDHDNLSFLTGHKVFIFEMMDVPPSAEHLPII